jgi:hypothetical protein
MTATSIAAESATARCTICAQPVRRGVRLCTQCQAAVKRARQVPSLQSELLPQAAVCSAAPAVLGSTNQRRPRPRHALRAGLPPIPGAWGIFATLVAFGAAVSVTGYFAMGKQEDEASQQRSALVTRAAPAAARGEDGSRRLAPSTTADRGGPTDPVAAPPEPGVPRAPATSPSRTTDGRPARGAKAASAASAAESFEAPGATFESRAVEASTVGALAATPAAPVTQAQDAAVADREQTLAAAVSRCESENLLVGLFCRERARLEYCDGHWGESPRCPKAARSTSTR